MKELGEIKLKFGSGGKSGEECLRFGAGHINLLVGPNDAGKSLMLREISGVNPRENSRIIWRNSYPETCIVSSVDWSGEYAQELKRQIIETVMTGPGQGCPEIKAQPWDSLIPNLEQAIKDLIRLRDELSLRLLDLIRTHAEDKFIRSISLGGIGVTESGPPLIVSALCLLVLSRAEMTASPDERAGFAVERQQKIPSAPLSLELAKILEQVLDATWRDTQNVLASLGIDVAELTFESLLNVNGLAGVLLKKLHEIPIVGQFLVQDPKVAAFPIPDTVTIERFERFAIVGGWLLDPTPLESLLKQLRSAYAECTWTNPECRADTAKRVLYLDGLARLEMTRSVGLKPYGDATEAEAPILALLKNPDMMKILRTMVASALGRHLVIDIVTQAPQVIWRLADEKPLDGLESSFSKIANDFHGRAGLLEERSDGIHAFIGMLAAILARASNLVFIDEPEAFLHPPLVRKLARQFISIAKQLDWQFFIATHSADLLESCVAVGADVNIIRLTHTKERSTARLLDSAALRTLALDPLLRAESTLSALFHEGAVICEAVADRVLYREVNERLLLSDDDGGLESCVFLNAQNWQTVARMIAPLRRMGVAAAAVLDADALFGSEFGAILDAAQVPKILRDGWLQQRTGLKDKLVKRMQPPNGKIEIKGNIISKFKPTESKVFKTICTNMAEYGVFLVPVGELEDWLSDFGLKRSSDKSKWLRSALDRLGIDPEAPGYARPTNGDIWQFMRDVNGWILDPDREGTSPTPNQDD